MLRSACLCMTVVVLGLAVGQADAKRAATAAERGEILQVLHRAKGGCYGEPRRYCEETVRISTVRPSWAAVYSRPAKAVYRAEVPTRAASLHRVDGEWDVVHARYGGGCGVPQVVRRDLGLSC